MKKLILIVMIITNPNLPPVDVMRENMCAKPCAKISFVFSAFLLILMGFFALFGATEVWLNGLNTIGMWIASSLLPIGIIVILTLFLCGRRGARVDGYALKNQINERVITCLESCLPLRDIRRLHHSVRGPGINPNNDLLQFYSGGMGRAYEVEPEPLLHGSQQFHINILLLFRGAGTDLYIGSLVIDTNGGCTAVMRSNISQQGFEGQSREVEQSLEFFRDAPFRTAFRYFTTDAEY